MARMLSRILFAKPIVLIVAFKWKASQVRVLFLNWYITFTLD
jgi:hypothetical protein